MVVTSHLHAVFSFSHSQPLRTGTQAPACWDFAVTGQQFLGAKDCFPGIWKRVVSFARGLILVRRMPYKTLNYYGVSIKGGYFSSILGIFWPMAWIAAVWLLTYTDELCFDSLPCSTLTRFQPNQTAWSSFPSQETMSKFQVKEMAKWCVYRVRYVSEPVFLEVFRN